MQIPYSYLEDEVRDGFYVDSLMKCSWAAQLKVLEKIDEICKKYNIQYQAAFGTMLGAVRHGGFIPWDDDMDISMKRQDYKKFLKVVQKELPEEYDLLNYKTQEKYREVISRVINTTEIRFGKEHLEKNYFFPFPAGVDIFPLDYISKNKGEMEIIKTLIKDIRVVAENYSNGKLEEEKFEQYLKRFEEDCKLKIPRDEKVIEHLYDIVVSLHSLFSDEEADEVSFMLTNEEEKGFSKEYYDKVTYLPFEQMMIPMPIAYDSILKKKFGNYMKIVRGGSDHEYPLYDKSFKCMEEKGIKWPRFEYGKRTIREENGQRGTLGEDNLQLLEKIHLAVYQLLKEGNKETVMELLAKSQDCAVSLGEKVENITGKCEQLITALEEYCELTYQIYQILDSGEELNSEGMFGILQEQLAVIKEAFEKEYKQKKKIVFIIDKASRWKSLESEWKVAKEDENNIVSVMAVPYCYKMFDGTVIEEHYEGNLFPEYVDIVDYKTFDLEQLHPDIIYINSPYDEYNYFTSIHYRFYSSKLVNYCDKLIYIPWFVISEITREDEISWKSMRHFVTMPGVVNADQVIVQSEQMKWAYVDYLTDWAGEETRDIWEEKICGLGSPLLEVENNQEELDEMIPESWKSYLYKENGERKKVILYKISPASFIDYKEKAVDRFRRTLETFEENKDNICLLWYWDRTMEEALRKNYPSLWNEVCTQIKAYKEQEWGIYETEADKDLMVRFSDAYYGDGCVLSQAMLMAKKVVILQNFKS